jgi:hypothetical protein
VNTIFTAIFFPPTHAHMTAMQEVMDLIAMLSANLSARASVTAQIRELENRGVKLGNTFVEGFDKLKTICMQQLGLAQLPPDVSTLSEREQLDFLTRACETHSALSALHTVIYG